MVKDIVMLGNPFLRIKCERVEDYNKLKSLLEDLQDTLKALQKSKRIGRAIAAPQIGYNKRVVYAHLKDREITMINPTITYKSKEMINVWDSCFSFDVAFFVKIQRHKHITVQYQDKTGRKVIEDFSDDLAELFQHEIDHLDGIVATDYLTDNKDIITRQEWEKLSH